MPFYKLYPKDAIEWLRFNFGFSIMCAVLTLAYFNINSFLPALVAGVIAVYVDMFTLDYMTIVSSCAIYSFILLQAVIVLIVIFNSTSDTDIIVISVIAAAISCIIIFVTAISIQYRTLNNRRESNIEAGNGEESGLASNINDNTRNYSTFNSSIN